MMVLPTCVVSDVVRASSWSSSLSTSGKFEFGVVVGGAAAFEESRAGVPEGMTEEFGLVEAGLSAPGFNKMNAPTAAATKTPPIPAYIPVLLFVGVCAGDAAGRGAGGVASSLLA